MCRLDKIQTFFGPGIVAKLKETEQASGAVVAACHLLLVNLLALVYVWHLLHLAAGRGWDEKATNPTGILLAY